MSDYIALAMFYAAWGGFWWTICEFIPTTLIQNHEKLQEMIERKIAKK